MKKICFFPQFFKVNKTFLKKFIEKSCLLFLYVEVNLCIFYLTKLKKNLCLNQLGLQRNCYHRIQYTQQLLGTFTRAIQIRQQIQKKIKARLNKYGTEFGGNEQNSGQSFSAGKKLKQNPQKIVIASHFVKASQHA